MEMAERLSEKKRPYRRSSGKKPSDVILLDAVVRVGAKKGIENTSTRAIAAEAGNGMTDTVIYRYFSSKEELMQKAFLRESAAFMQEVANRFSVLWETNLPWVLRARFLWNTIWVWLTSHKEASTFMIRYYYSASFDEVARKGYHETWKPLADRLRDLLPNQDTEALIYMILETTAAASYPVCCGRVPDSASASEYGFRRVMGSVNEFLSD